MMSRVPPPRHASPALNALQSALENAQKTLQHNEVLKSPRKDRGRTIRVEQYLKEFLRSQSPPSIHGKEEQPNEVTPAQQNNLVERNIEHHRDVPYSNVVDTIANSIERTRLDSPHNENDRIRDAAYAESSRSGTTNRYDRTFSDEQAHSPKHRRNPKADRSRSPKHPISDYMDIDTSNHLTRLYKDSQRNLTNMQNMLQAEKDRNYEQITNLKLEMSNVEESQCGEIAHLRAENSKLQADLAEMSGKADAQAKEFVSAKQAYHANLRKLQDDMKRVSISTTQVHQHDADIKKAHVKQLEDTIKQQDTKIREQESQIEQGHLDKENLKRSHQRLLDKLKEENEEANRMNAINVKAAHRAELEKALRETHRGSGENKADIEARYSQSLREARADLRSVMEHHERDVHDLRNELRKAEAKYKKEIEQLQRSLSPERSQIQDSMASHEATMLSLQEHYKASMREMETHLTEAKSTYDNTIEGLREDLERSEAERLTLQKELAAARTNLSSIEAESSKRHQDNVRQLEVKYHDDMHKIRLELESLRSHHQNDIMTLNERGSTLEHRRKSATEEYTLLKASYDRLTTDFSKLEKAYTEIIADLTAMRKEKTDLSEKLALVNNHHNNNDEARPTYAGLTAEIERLKAELTTLRESERAKPHLFDTDEEDFLVEARALYAEKVQECEALQQRLAQKGAPASELELSKLRSEMIQLRTQHTSDLTIIATLKKLVISAAGGISKVGGEKMEIIERIDSLLYELETLRGKEANLQASSKWQIEREELLQKVSVFEKTIWDLSRVSRSNSQSNLKTPRANELRQPMDHAGCRDCNQKTVLDV